MVETIAPVVYGDKRRYQGAVALHALAAGVAGALFGVLLSLVGIGLQAPWGATGAVIVALAGIAYAARELFGLPLPIFDRKKQVPDWWRTFYSPHVAATLYGAGLGIGFLTFLRYGTYVVVCVIAIASGDLRVGALLGATFGMTRGLTSLMSARSRDEEDAAGVVLRLEEVAVGQGPRTVNGLALLLVAIVSMATACDRPSVAHPSSPAVDPGPFMSVDDTLIEARRYSMPKSLGRLRDPRIQESSGLAASRSQKDVLWTHNDSGDGPYVYAISSHGRSLGRWRVTGANAVDWEAISIGSGSGPTDDIFVGDIGDNSEERARVTVYRFPEPNVRAEESGTSAARGLHFTYPDGPVDAEALLVHPHSGDLYIVSKEFSGRASVYVARAPLRSGEMQQIERLRLPGALGGVTGGDISSDGERLVLCTYLGAFEFYVRVPSAPFDDVWKSSWNQIAFGRRSQGEAIAYSADGEAIVATSEGAETRVQAVTVRDD